MPDTLEKFYLALAAPRRSPDIPERADLYGWLMGSWALDVRHYGVDVAARHLEGEAHFAWVLEGRAVQDVWLMPARGQRDVEPAPRMYGTTLRVWDPLLDAWRVTWTDPSTGRRDQLLGRRIGEDIVQVGAHADGTPIRWCFTEITPSSFRWTGEVLEPDGKTWRLEGDFRATRRR